MTTKTCPVCREVKSLDEFPKSKHCAGGLYTYCRPCAAARNRESRERNKKPTDYHRRRHLKREFGLSMAQFHSLWDSSGGKCAICCEELSIEKHRYAIDHNHNTGEIRGILCPTCNRGIGYLKDNPVILDAAADYLRTNGHYG